MQNSGDEVRNTRRTAVSAWRNSRAVSMPLTSGMIMSSRMMSARDAAWRASRSSPRVTSATSTAVPVSIDQRSIIRCSLSRKATSSSQAIILSILSPLSSSILPHWARTTRGGAPVRASRCATRAERYCGGERCLLRYRELGYPQLASSNMDLPHGRIFISTLHLGLQLSCQL